MWRRESIMLFFNEIPSHWFSFMYYSAIWFYDIGNDETSTDAWIATFTEGTKYSKRFLSKSNWQLFFSSRACIFLIEYNYEAATKTTFPDLKMNPVHVFKSQLVQNCSYSAITLINLRVCINTRLPYHFSIYLST